MNRPGPWTSDALLAHLDELGIGATTLEHPQVFTVEEARSLKGELPGAHTKNLFLRDKKGTMWLVVALADRSVDLRALAEHLGTRGRLSFGSPERLMRTLGIEPGSVSPLAVVNDTEGAVTVVLDEGLRDYDVWNVHPLVNSRTTQMEQPDLLRFLEHTGHDPVWAVFG